MRDLDSFGSLLHSFRTRLGEPRHSVGWLAGKLGYPSSTIYGWENGDLSKGLPSRATILHIGYLFGLQSNEVNNLIAACGAEKKQPTHAARYAPLSIDELSAWASLQGPSSSSLAVWSNQLHAAQAAYRAGELRSSRRLAESILRQISMSADEEVGAELWSRDERDEMSRLWILAWREYFESCALIETGATIAHACQPFLVQAQRMAAAIGDPRLQALALHLEGDYYHNQGLHSRALDFHLHAFHVLGGSETDPPLAATIQRLIVLDGMHVLSREHLLEQVRKGRRMADQLMPQHSDARVLVREAAGRALGVLGYADCWSILADAEAEARQQFPVGHVTALYSRMLALEAHPSGTDLDQMRVVGGLALVLAVHSGWERRVAQVTRTAAGVGITLQRHV